MKTIQPEIDRLLSLSRLLSKSDDNDMKDFKKLLFHTTLLIKSKLNHIDVNDKDTRAKVTLSKLELIKTISNIY